MACLVEHKRPVRHASVAWTCEYLPDQWNAPLSPQPPPSGMIPNPEPHIYCTFSSFALVWLTWGVIGIHTCLCELGTRACRELRSPLVLFSFTDFTQVQLYRWCNDSFTGAMVKFSLTVLLFDFMLMKWTSGTHELNMNAQCHEKVLAPSWCLLHSSHT